MKHEKFIFIYNVKFWVNSVKRFYYHSSLQRVLSELKGNL